MQLFTLLPLLFLSLTSCGQENNNVNQPLSINFDSITKVLEAIYETDQAPRAALERISQQFGNSSEEMRNHWKHLRITDSTNLIAVSAILDRHGWLSEKETSPKAHDALWLVIQHSDLSTQLKYQPLLELAIKAGKIKPKRYAYLVDRIKTSQGKFQIYGTQFQVNPSGKTFLYPIADEHQVNKRRKEVGLDSLERIAKEMGLDYKAPKHNPYKGKIVMMGLVVDTTHKPLRNVSLLFKGKVLGKTNSQGEYFIVIEEKAKAKELQLKKEGYRSALLPIESEKEVYELMFVMSRK